MTDPCLVWPVMQTALDKLLVGEGLALGRFGEDELQFSKADIPALKSRIADLKAECAAVGGTRRRRAFRAGF